MDKMAAQEYLTQGAVLLGQGMYEEALAYYEKAESEDHMEIEVYLSKGLAMANLDRLDGAKAEFEKALKINRSSGLAYFHLGNIAVMQNDIALGFENYNKAIAGGFDDAQLYYSIGLLNEENSDFDLAIKNYNKAISRDAMRPDIRIRKARLLHQANQIPESLQAIDELLLTNPDLPEGYHFKFDVLLQSRQYDKADELLGSALELFPDQLDFALDRASLLIARQELDSAMAALEELETNEDATDDILRRVYFERAQIYASNEDVKAAISELEKAKALSDATKEFDVEVMFLLANCHMVIEEYDKLLDYAELLLDKAEGGYAKETARYFKPLALKMLGRNDEAKTLYDEAINEYRNQSLAVPGNLDAYLLRIMCLRDIEQCDKALELVDYVITLQPEHTEPRLLRVAILEALGRNDEAEKESKIVKAMLPEELRR